MIESSNVFILGAGASIPFGYPSGYKLQEIIYDYLDENQGKEENELYRQGFDFKLQVEFRNSLIASNLQSIDFFLKNRPEYMSIGKTCIARTLVKFERPYTVITFNDHWLRYLWSLLINDATIESFTKNKISFITFNYDRTLEYFLFESLRNTFGKSEEDTIELLKLIPIIHIHGKLGNLPWEDKVLYRDYSYNLGNYKNYKGLSKEIKIIYENSHESEDVKKAKRLIKKAQNIHFLGFGYHKLNLDLLELGNISKEQSILGTTYGLSKQETNRIKKMYPDKLYRIDHLPQTIYDYLRSSDIL